jgi:ATP-binding cassette, subfamily B, bacterial
MQVPRPRGPAGPPPSVPPPGGRSTSWSALGRLRRRQEWQFLAALWRADPRLAAAWWAVLACRGVLPTVFAVASGALVGAVQGGRDLAGPLAAVGLVFVARQVLLPVHQAVGANLGDRTAAWLYDRLTEAGVRPAGMGHLEDRPWPAT